MTNRVRVRQTREDDNAVVDTSVIGKPLDPSTLVIERGPVTNFAKAVKSDSPVYRNPEAARRPLRQRAHSADVRLRSR